MWSAAWLLLFSVGAQSSTAETLVPAQRVIQQTSDELQTTLQKPEYKHDFKKATVRVDNILNAHLDLDRIAMLVLGRNLNAANAEQRERFKKEFRSLLVRTYTTAFMEYANWQIHFLPLRMQEGDSKAFVRTEIIQPGSKPTPVDYRMVFTQGEWKVYDILIGGISLLQNYRTSFANEAAGGGMDRLLDHLAQRNESAMSAPTSKE